MQFEWDPKKDQQNHAKHGVTFDEAEGVFGDPFAFIIVAHTDREERVRIINAREVTAAERHVYEKDR